MNIIIKSHIHINVLKNDWSALDILINVEFLDKERKEKYGLDSAGFTSVFLKVIDGRSIPTVFYVWEGTDIVDIFSDKEKEELVKFARKSLLNFEKEF